MVTLTSDSDAQEPLELAAVIHRKALPELGDETGPKGGIVVDYEAVVDVDQDPEDELVLCVGEEARVDGRANKTP